MSSIISGFRRQEYQFFCEVDGRDRDGFLSEIEPVVSGFDSEEIRNVRIVRTILNTKIQTSTIEACQKGIVACGNEIVEKQRFNHFVCTITFDGAYCISLKNLTNEKFKEIIKFLKTTTVETSQTEIINQISSSSISSENPPSLPDDSECVHAEDSRLSPNINAQEYLIFSEIDETVHFEFLPTMNALVTELCAENSQKIIKNIIIIRNIAQASIKATSCIDREVISHHFDCETKLGEMYTIKIESLTSELFKELIDDLQKTTVETPQREILTKVGRLKCFTPHIPPQPRSLEPRQLPLPNNNGRRSQANSKCLLL